MWYLPLLAFSMGLMLLRMLLMARLLDVPQFAQFSAGLLISTTFGMLTCLGLYQSLQRDFPIMLVRGRERAALIALAQCVVIAGGCAVGGALIAATGLPVAGLSSAMVLTGVLHGLSQQLFLVVTLDSRSRGRPLQFATQNLWRALAVSAAGLAVALLIGAALWILVVEAVISLSIAASILQRVYGRADLRGPTAFRLALRRLPRARWGSAAVLLAVAVIGFVLTSIDRWIAAEALATAAFAQYAFAWTLLLLAQAVQAMIGASMFPLVARRYAEGGIAAGMRTAAGASLGLLAAGLLLAPPLGWALDAGIERWFTAYDGARALIPIFLVVAVLRVSDFWTSLLLVAGLEVRLLVLQLLAGLAIGSLWLLAMPAAGRERLGTVDLAWLAAALALGGYLVTVLACWHAARR